MKDLMSSPGQVDLRDEICLAVRFLNLRGVSCRMLSEKYHISSRTLSKIREGKKCLARNREDFYCLLMKELDMIYRIRHDPEILCIITEVGRVHAGLPHNTEVWYIIDKDY